MERKRSSEFRRIFTVVFDRLFYVRLGKVNVDDCPAGQDIGPAGLEPPTGAKNSISYCENTRKSATSFSFHDPNCFYFISCNQKSSDFETLWMIDQNTQKYDAVSLSILHVIFSEIYAFKILENIQDVTCNFVFNTVRGGKF